jgi:8-oxo-dGTP pyrophosphatase MutT (NUDIX family)
MVEERAGDKLVLNQPAGHLEQGESLVAAAAREALEETGHRFDPEHVVGFYLWRSEEADTTYLRIAFCGSVMPSADVAAASLDDGIVAVHWLTRTQLLRRSHQLRSPMVLRCLDDYLAGQRYPLDCLSYLEHRAADLDTTEIRLRAFT